jgi:nucleoside-diphosphate-sugar epimerase
MIVGNGLLANAFAQYFAEDPDVIIFASGVSNSGINDKAAFMREKKMLESILNKRKRTVYFSTCSITDTTLNQTSYVLHKQEMENLIKQSDSYEIFRLPQVVGKTSNRHTLTNFIFSNILANKPFEVWRHAYRNIIDVTDIALIAKEILEDGSNSNQTINIAAQESLPVIELVKIFEMVLGKNAIYSIVDKGESYFIDAERALEFSRRAGVDLGGNYAERVIRKYYSKF